MTNKSENVSSEASIPVRANYAHTHIKDFVEGFEIDTGEGIYKPTEHERFVIDEAIHSFLSYPDAAPPVAQPDQDLLRQALDALEGANEDRGNSRPTPIIAVLRARLASLVAQPVEPVAWIDRGTLGRIANELHGNKEIQASLRRAELVSSSDVPLYATPPSMQAPIKPESFSNLDASSIVNHAEALQLANLKRQESNLARCYLDLQAPKEQDSPQQNPFDGGSNFMVSLDSLLRHFESFEDGKVPIEVVREFVLRFQSRPAAMKEPK